MQLYQIVYMSDSMLPVELGSYTTEIQRILEASRERNSKNGITGALMFSDGRFAQVLEGPYSTLRSTFESIASNLRLLEYSRASERVFASWSMAYTEGGEQIDVCRIDMVKPLFRSPEGSTILARLRSLVRPDPVEGVTL